MKKIKNPLTIIGIFAGIAEVAGTVVLPFVDNDLQKIFIWYVMGFPVLLVILFFTTLNKNPRVLYAPSDFNDEKNFMQLLTRTENIITDIIESNPSIEMELKPLEKLIERVAMESNISNNTVKIVNAQIHSLNLETGGFLICENSIYQLLDRTTTIGRGDNVDIMVYDIAISRIHCSIECKDNVFFLKDLGASNGLYLNGKKIASLDMVKLKDNDVIHVARTRFIFKHNDSIK